MSEHHNHSVKDNNADNNPHSLVDWIEIILFNSRWILAPMYIGLVITLVLLLLKFGQKFFKIVPNVFDMTGGGLVLATLELVDVVLVANLLLMIIFSGYENFVSKIDVAEDHVDRPSWMGTIDYSGLKMKIIGSIVAISSIELLKYFVDLSKISKEDLAWLIGLHMSFVVSGILFALMEKYAHASHAHNNSEHDKKSH